MWVTIICGEGATPCCSTFDSPKPTLPMIPNQPASHNAGRLREATVGGDLRLETGALSSGEVVHATIVGVVHVVVETGKPTVRVSISVRERSSWSLRISSSTGAGVSRSRAAIGGAGLRRGVIDVVTWSAAAALEGVVQSHPVSNLDDPVISPIPSTPSRRDRCLPGFVGESPTLVVRNRSPTRDGRVEDHDTIVFGVGGVVVREGGISQESGSLTRSKADGVDIESVGTALPQLVLHRSLGGAAEDNVSSCGEKYV